MAWAVQDVAKLMKQGDYTLPQSHIDITRNMMSENDSVYFYFTSLDAPKKKEGNVLQINQLFEKYSNFCYASARIRPVGLRAFLSRVSELSSLLDFEVRGLEVVGLAV